MRLKNKKGSVADLFVLVVFMSTLAIMIPIGWKVSTMFRDNIPSGLPQIANDTITAGATQVESGMLDYLFVGIFIALSMSMILLAFLVQNPAPFFVVYILALIVFAVVSVPMSNVYQEMVNGDQFTSMGADVDQSTLYIMTNLPMFIIIIGLITSIILFGKSAGGGGTYV